MIDIGFPVIQYGCATEPFGARACSRRAVPRGDRRVGSDSSRLDAQKNPGLDDESIKELSKPQWQATVDFDTDLAEELMGISQGANLPPVDLIVLNNYTDFRDIHVADQGCSTIYVNRQDPIAGQTWDMHGTAKNYVCCLEIAAEETSDRQVLFSLVGCLGLMGYNGCGLMVGVNNVNTDGARPGVIWPALVRGLVHQTSLDAMVKMLTAADVTSGHSYLLGSTDRGEFWEVMPDLAERVSTITRSEAGHVFHTNHCLAHRRRSVKRPVPCRRRQRSGTNCWSEKSELSNLLTMPTDY